MRQANLFDYEEPKEEKVLTVADVNNLVEGTLNAVPVLRNFWVSGEISGYKPDSAWCLFTLKGDSKNVLNAAIWPNKLNAEIKKLLVNGNMVEAHGSIAVHKGGSKYQITIDRMRPRGLGKFYEELERLKRKLYDEGLCSEERKRPLPKLPRTIGIVSSTSAAGFKDMLRVFREQWPLVELIVAPAIVQGNAAPASIIAALKKLYAVKPDVIILARGGGSMEDLWCFNDEQVARTLAASPVPTITGVGHESDWTLVDHVADHRSLTPTAAAGDAVPKREQVLFELRRLEEDLDDAMDDLLHDKMQDLHSLMQRLEQKSPEKQVENEKNALEQMTARLDNAEKTYTTRLNDMLSAMTKRLELLDPANVMRRGYAFVQKGEDVITSANELNAGDRIAVRFYDGEKSALVE